MPAFRLYDAACLTCLIHILLGGCRCFLRWGSPLGCWECMRSLLLLLTPALLRPPPPCCSGPVLRRGCWGCTRVPSCYPLPPPSLAPPPCIAYMHLAAERLTCPLRPFWHAFVLSFLMLAPSLSMYITHVVGGEWHWVPFGAILHHLVTVYCAS